MTTLTITGNVKRQHSAEFKTKVALDLLKEIKTVAQVSSEYNIHPTQARRWREQAVLGLQGIFAQKYSDELRRKDSLIEELYKLSSTQFFEQIFSV